jgi:hypothetical protein
LGGAYHKPEKDLNSLPRETLLKNIHHRNYMIRTQAGKALREVGAFDDLEKLLRDPDPRVRRAALDGLIDYNYWFASAATHPTEKFLPAMLEAITKMLSDPGVVVGGRWRADGAQVRPGQGHPAAPAAHRAMDEALRLVAARVRLHGALRP